MNPRAEIWNVLHDGGIAGIEGVAPGDLTIRVNIPYLRRMFSERGDDILLRLHGCNRFVMKIWDGDVLTEDPRQIVASNTEILNTESEDIPVHIVTTQGEIDAAFQSFTLALDDGQPITFEELCGACERYWRGWKETAACPKGQAAPSEAASAPPPAAHR
jgi:hypothetical protein